MVNVSDVKMSNVTPDIGYGENRRRFEQEHSQELGVKRYVLVSLRDTFVPLVALVGGGAAGYFGLRGAVKWVAGKQTKALDEILAVKNKIKEVGTGDTYNKLKHTAPETAEIFRDNGDDVIGLIKNGWKKFTNKEQRVKFWDALEIGEAPEKFPKWIGAGIGGFAGSLAAGTFLGYEKWKKEEMTNVAAREISQDISKLELFRPNDEQLVSEVKRLRAMVDEQDQKHLASTKPQISVDSSTADVSMMQDVAVKENQL